MVGMKRRTFIALSATSPFFLNIHAYAKEIPTDVWEVIESVQNILFPKTEQMPSAKDINALFYLVSNSSSEYFDANDLDLLVKGASVFDQKFPYFSHQDTESKNKTLEIASKNEYLETWLSRLIYYTIEAMFSDPIYGGNTNELGWTSTLHTTGNPRPVKKYGRKI